MEGERISVIVPCYNIEPFIANTVKTICGQSYQNLEIILVDDGSTDSTAKILDQLAEQDSRIKVIHKENGGVTRARLTGVAAASGEWIGFVDGDDAIEPEMYKHLLNNAHQHNADISHCGYQMVFPSRTDYYYNTGCLEEHDNLTGLKELLSGTRIEPGLCNKLYRKDLFYNLLHENRMDLSIKINEDLLMNYYLFSQASESVYEDFCPYHYMVRKGSAATSAINEHKLRDPLLVQHILKENTIDYPELQTIINGRLAAVLVSQATMPAKDQKELIEPYRKNARQELRQLLPELWKKPYGKRTRLLSAWAVFWPASYRWAHKLYAQLKGTDRKYEVS